MVLSGIAMVVYDSRIVQRNFAKVRNKFRRNGHELQIELGTVDSPPDESQEGDSRTAQGLESVRVDPHPDANLATGVNPPRGSRTERTKVEPEASLRNTTVAIRADDIALPYSIWVGLSLFGLFLVSFVVIMVVRGVVDNLPLDFRFFANIYLAGTFHLR